MSTDFLWIKTDRHRLICFCIATKFVLCHKIWSWTKTLQPINYQIDFINFFLPKISSDRNVCFSNPFIKKREEKSRYISFYYCYNKYLQAIEIFKYSYWCSLTQVSSWLDSVLIPRLEFMSSAIVMSFKLFFKKSKFLPLNTYLRPDGVLMLFDLVSYDNINGLWDEFSRW